MGLLDELRTARLSGRRDPHMAGKPILEATHLNVRYDGRSALEDISFSLVGGERVALVGPNGAGKSTLFKVIAGVMSATSGDLNIYGKSPGVHVCIAYVPQRSQVDWNFPVSVADVVMMGRIGKLGLLRWPSKKDWRYVHQALEEVGLGDLSGRQISELSGGQQQRVFIARALAQEAELLLMDEPLTGLDLSSQQGLFDILDDLRQRGVTIMVATHDLDQAAEHFDRVMLLNRRLLGFGRPGDVFTPERLVEAYGGRLRLLSSGDGLLALADTCCDDGQHDHAHN
jgi:manganese/iron transport system ATP-binding protein